MNARSTTGETRRAEPAAAESRRASLRDRPLIQRYGVALVVVALATVLSILARPLLGTLPFFLIYPAVVVAAWYGGLGPGIVASVAGMVAANSWLVPQGHGNLSAQDLPVLILFLGLAAMVSVLTGGQRAARREAEARTGEAVRLADQLQEQAAELEHQIEESQVLQQELEEQHQLLTETRDLMLLEERRLRFLGEVSRMLGASLDFEDTIRTVAEAFVPDLSDWCAVDMVVEPGTEVSPPRVKRLAVAHKNPEKVAWARELEQRVSTDWSAHSGRPKVIRRGVPEFLPVIDDAFIAGAARSPEELALLREIGLSAYLCVPIHGPDGVLGAITLAMTESGRHYTESDLRLAQEVAGRAAVAIRHARLFEEVRRAREEAESANHAKTEFLAVMSHELRTPLNAISGYSQLLELGIRGELNEQQRQDLQRIQRSARHLLSLINQILNFARLEAGQVSTEPRRVALTDALTDLDALFGGQLAAKGIAFERRTPGDVVLWCDPEKLHQILLNLLSNAVKFTPEGGRISLLCETDPQFAHIVVEDTGPGVPSENRERIFEPFVQLERGLTSAQEGTGLGLAISRELARAMGGDLRAEQGGQGARFRLTVPLVHGARRG